MSAMQFPSSKQFQEAEASNQAAAGTQAIKWSELTIGTVYAITKLKMVKTKFGLTAVGDLETEAGTEHKVWLMPRLINDLQDRKLPVFVLNKGLKQTVKDKSRSYYDYTLINN